MSRNCTPLHLPAALRPEAIRLKLDLRRPATKVSPARVDVDLEGAQRTLLSPIDIGHLDRVQQLFPGERKPETILALTIWLSYACKIDDYVESLLHEESHKGLLGWRLLFETACSNVGVTDATLMEPGTCMTRQLLSDLRRLLPDDEGRTRVVRTMMEVVQGFEEEVEYLNDEHPHTDRYMQIRNKTISVKPLLAILALGVNISASMLDKTDVGRKLHDLEDEVSIMIGLQNDLLGLARDVVGRKKMNYVMVHNEQTHTFPTSEWCDGADLRQGTQAAIERHNMASTRAAQVYQDLMACTSAPIRQYSCQVFALPLLHSEIWMLSSRYQVARG